MNIHLENGIPNPGIFYYEGIPVAYRKSMVGMLQEAIIRFAPLLRVQSGTVEIDWEFFSKAGYDYQNIMTRILLGIGILSFNADQNIRIVPACDLLDRSYMPRAFSRRLYFHVSRYNDALAYIQYSTDILQKHGLNISPSQLRAVQTFAPTGEFDPNLPTCPVLITGCNCCVC